MDFLQSDSIRLASSASEAFRVVLYNKTMQRTLHRLETQRYRYDFTILNKSLVWLVAFSKLPNLCSYEMDMPIEEARSFYRKQLANV